MKVNIFWFRRDLRLNDNRGFYKALQGKFPVVPIFILDSHILDKLPKDDARVTFIWKTVQKINIDLQTHGSSLAIYHGAVTSVFQRILSEYDVQNVICNHDYEPHAVQRDLDLQHLLSEEKIGFHTFKDQVIFEKDDIVKADNTPYVVYTPYMKSWKSKFQLNLISTYTASSFYDNLIKDTQLAQISFSETGFITSSIIVKDFDVSSNLIDSYESLRNFPNKQGTSNLSSHLRFGTVSIRQIVARAIKAQNETFLNELIWREFYMQILWHFPETTTQSFRKKYDRILWNNNEDDFNRWKDGTTGYPLIDAGMRELNQTGYMHNRVRMVVASFLCKHLLIDWRWGAAYFAEKLLDYEQASNIGNWQWAAGSGVDAAPYFRIFNPTTQMNKFDNDKQYIKKWVAEYDTPSYPEPMVDHKEARERCLKVYKEALL